MTILGVYCTINGHGLMHNRFKKHFIFEYFYKINYSIGASAVSPSPPVTGLAVTESGALGAFATGA